MLTQTPVSRGIPMRRADFKTFIEALDYASGAQSGMNFYNARGSLTHALSYADLIETSREIAASLLETGLAHGARVGIVADTSPDFVTSFIGSLYAGLLPCPMPLPKAFGDQSAYTSQIARISEVADLSAILAPGNFAQIIESHLDVSDLTYFGPVDTLQHAKTTLPETVASPDSLAYLQFSSGTTSAPKGVSVTHRALMANIAAMSVHALDITGDDRGFSWLPFYHDMGLVGNMLLPIANQLSASYLATNDFVRRPALWPRLMSETQSTIAYAPSFGYHLAARAARFKDPIDLSQWRVAGIGGDAIKPSDLASFTDAYEPYGFSARSFLPSYGMAELTLGMTFAEKHRGWSSVDLDPLALEQGKALPANGHGSANSHPIVVSSSWRHALTNP